MRYGFIGCGTMGSAMARAVCQGAGARQVWLANRTPAKADALAGELGCRSCGQDNEAVAAGCDVVFLGVKPQMMAGMLAGIAPALHARAQAGEGVVLVSMAAGLSIERIRALAGGGTPWAVVRIMPNTPATVGQGMIPYCADAVPPEKLQSILQALAPAGRLDPLPEALMDAAGCVAGCGPAWAFQFVEALADGGVAAGLPRDKAQAYAAQMLLGSARLLLESGAHPGALKDAVCSPGGSTIQGVRVLEQRGFRGAVTDAVLAAYQKTRELGNG